MNTRPIPGIAILDIIIFTTIFWMILKRGRQHNNPIGRGGHHRGNWAPGWAYLPVMLIRWAIVPHKDWMCEHKHRQDVMDSQLHNHHHHYHHHHQQQQHRHGESYCGADHSKPVQNVHVMDAFFGQ
jgi:hypothetical protein